MKFNPDNSLDLIRAMTMHSPLCKRGGRGDLSVAGTQKSPSIPLLKRGRLVKFTNGLSGFIKHQQKMDDAHQGLENSA